ncbi:hypothetical protein HDU76_002122 [Blyttiomyces sp. JEL0837]|nr:hypothetical protein HDU76_002122 [Blyttiomyces sp. JEL0837]
MELGSKVNVICSYREGPFVGDVYWQQLIPFAGALNPRSVLMTPHLFDQVRNTEDLILYHNKTKPLTDFQDFRNAGPTLRQLTLGDSNLTRPCEVSTEGLAYLDKLRVLRFRDGWILQMTDVDWVLPNLGIISLFTPVSVETFLAILQRSPLLQEFETVSVDHADKEFFATCETACNNCLGFNLITSLNINYQRMSLIELFKIAERLHRPFPNLQFLTINLNDISANDFLSCFVSADILTDIFAHLEESSNHLSEVLSFPSQPQRYCPNPHIGPNDEHIINQPYHQPSSGGPCKHHPLRTTVQNHLPQASNGLSNCHGCDGPIPKSIGLDVVACNDDCRKSLENLNIDQEDSSTFDLESCFNVSEDMLVDIFIRLEVNSKRLKQVHVSGTFSYEHIPGDNITYLDRFAKPLKERFKKRRMKILRV